MRRERQADGADSDDEYMPSSPPVSTPINGGGGGAGAWGRVPVGPASWPDGKLSACQRCGVWGHTACFEFDATAFLTKGVKAGGGGGNSQKRGREGGKLPTAAAAEPAAALTTLAKVEPAGAVGQVSGEAAGEREAEEAGGLSSGGVSVMDVDAGASDGGEGDGDRGAKGDGDDAAGAKAGGGRDAEAGGIADDVAGLPPPPPPRPPAICWMCMQERAESEAVKATIAAMYVPSVEARAGSTAGSGGAAAPRRAGKVHHSNPSQDEIVDGGEYYSRINDGIGRVRTARQFYA